MFHCCSVSFTVCDKYIFDRFAQFLLTLFLRLSGNGSEPYAESSKSPEKCGLEMFFSVQDKLVSLFEQKTVKGWWPCVCDRENEKILAVKSYTQTRVIVVLRNSLFLSSFFSFSFFLSFFFFFLSSFFLSFFFLSFFLSSGLSSLLFFLSFLFFSQISFLFLSLSFFLFLSFFLSFFLLSFLFFLLLFS